MWYMAMPGFACTIQQVWITVFYFEMSYLSDVKNVLQRLIVSGMAIVGRPHRFNGNWPKCAERSEAYGCSGTVIPPMVNFMTYLHAFQKNIGRSVLYFTACPTFRVLSLLPFFTLHWWIMLQRCYSSSTRWRNHWKFPSLALWRQLLWATVYKTIACTIFSTISKSGSIRGVLRNGPALITDI